MATKIVSKRHPYYSLDIDGTTNTEWIKFQDLENELESEGVVNINFYTYDLYDIIGGNGIEIFLTAVDDDEVDAANAGSQPDSIPGKLWTNGKAQGIDRGDGKLNDSDFTTSEVTAFRVVSDGSTSRLIVGGY